MFKFEITIEEEVLLKQLLDDNNSTRTNMLYELKSLVNNSDSNEDLSTVKSLFNKIQNTSNYEFAEYLKIIA